MVVRETQYHRPRIKYWTYLVLKVSVDFSRSTLFSEMLHLSVMVANLYYSVFSDFRHSCSSLMQSNLTASIVPLHPSHTLTFHTQVTCGDTVLNAVLSVTVPAIKIVFSHKYYLPFH